ncbi:MAG: signal peptidase II [Anaerolineales bacterium]
MDSLPPQISEELPSKPEKTAHNLWRDYFVLFLGAGSIVLLDTWTKSWAIATIPLGGAWLPNNLYWLMPFARLVHTSNVGTAFSMFDSIPQINVIIIILAVAVSVAVIVIFPKLEREDKNKENEVP